MVGIQDTNVGRVVPFGTHHVMGGVPLQTGGGLVHGMPSSRSEEHGHPAAHRDVSSLRPCGPLAAGLVQQYAPAGGFPFGRGVA